MLPRFRPPGPCPRPSGSGRQRTDRPLSSLGPVNRGRPTRADAAWSHPVTLVGGEAPLVLLALMPLGVWSHPVTLVGGEAEPGPCTRGGITAALRPIRGSHARLVKAWRHWAASTGGCARTEPRWTPGRVAHEQLFHGRDGPASLRGVRRRVRGPGFAVWSPCAPSAGGCVGPASPVWPPGAPSGHPAHRLAGSPRRRAQGYRATGCALSRSSARAAGAPRSSSRTPSTAPAP
jgi:hypothetical protein